MMTLSLSPKSKRWGCLRIAATLTPLLLLAVGCVSQRPADPSEVVDYTPDPKTASCLLVRDVEDFRFLNRRNLIVYAPRPLRVYHVVIAAPVGMMAFVRSISFSSNTGRVCGRPGDEIILPDPEGERLPVYEVYRLDEDGLREIRAAFEGKGDDSAWGRARPPR